MEALQKIDATDIAELERPVGLHGAVQGAEGAGDLVFSVIVGVVIDMPRRHG